MLEYLKNWDIWLFLQINGYHNQFWDFIMFWLSNKLIWIPFYLFLLYLSIKHYKKNSYLIIIFAILCVTITDQVTYHFFKDVFMRLRPCYEPLLKGKVYILNGYCGGQYGFISSHAANSFGIAVFISGTLGKKIKYLSIIMFLWTISICYSRIYLGVHYPADVICGALFGGACGFLMLKTSRFLINKY